LAAPRDGVPRIELEDFRVETQRFLEQSVLERVLGLSPVIALVFEQPWLVVGSLLRLQLPVELLTKLKVVEAAHNSSLIRKVVALRELKAPLCNLAGFAIVVLSHLSKSGRNSAFFPPVPLRWHIRPAWLDSASACPSRKAFTTFNTLASAG